MQDPTERIKALIAGRFGKAVDDVSDELSFQEDFGADSLDMVDFAVELGAAFNITVAAGQLTPQLTVRDAIQWVLLQRKGSTGRQGIKSDEAYAKRAQPDDDPSGDTRRLR